MTMVLPHISLPIPGRTTRPRKKRNGNFTNNNNNYNNNNNSNNNNSNNNNNKGISSNHDSLAHRTIGRLTAIGKSMGSDILNFIFLQ